MIQSTLCYLERDGKYLMLHRVKKKNDINKDKWIGVGGKFEEEESPEDCMKREILEETGLVAKSWKYCGIVTFVSDEAESEHMHLFHVFDWDGTEKVCDEGDLEWVPIEKVLSLPTWEGDRIFLHFLQDADMPFFSLKLRYQKDHLLACELNGKPYQK